MRGAARAMPAPPAALPAVSPVMQAIVVDASALASGLLPHEDGAAFRALLGRQPDLIAPWLLQAEIANILLVQERRGRVSADQGRRALALVADLGIAFSADADLPAVTVLARRHGLTVYDALYLDLALQRGAGLATLDAALIRAARAEGVPAAV